MPKKIERATLPINNDDKEQGCVKEAEEKSNVDKEDIEVEKLPNYDDCPEKYWINCHYVSPSYKERKEKMDKGHAALYDEKYGSQSWQYIIKVTVSELIKLLLKDEHKMKQKEIETKLGELKNKIYD